jgi:hypothetical protein
MGKIACGAFSDSGYVSGGFARRLSNAKLPRQFRRDFCQLRRCLS